MNTTHCGLCWKQSQTQGKLLAWPCDCHAIRMKTTEDGLEILKINGWLKIEKPLQILRFLRFGEYGEICLYVPQAVQTNDSGVVGMVGLEGSWFTFFPLRKYNSVRQTWI